MQEKQFSISKSAGYGLIILFSLTILFHLLVLSSIIDYSVVWGGRITSQSQMYVYEGAAFVFNALFLFIILVKTGVFKNKLVTKVIRPCLWFMFFFFLQNAVGNLLSINSIEKAIFTPLTILVSILCLVLILNRDSK